MSSVSVICSALKSLLGIIKKYPNWLQGGHKEEPKYIEKKNACFDIQNHKNILECGTTKTLKDQRELKEKMEENIKIKEPQYLMQEFCNTIKQLTGKNLKKIRSEIAESTGFSDTVIRKYEGETKKNKAELLLIGCVEVALKNSISEDIISEFIANYKQSFKSYTGYTVHLEKIFKNSNELRYSRTEDEQNEHIICPQVLKERLDSFLQKSTKRFLYLAGTSKSGITVSVIKYFEEKNNGKSLRIFNFYEKSIEEIESSMALKVALMQDECVVIHMGLQTFPLSKMKFIGNGKVIFLAHTPCENLYLENVEYVVFNDLVNKTKCTEELLEKYVPGFIEESSFSDEEAKNIFVSKMREKTGGLPLAVYELGTEIFEKEMLKYEGNLESFFSFPLYINSELKPVYENLWENLVAYMWKKTDPEAHSLIICASYFSGDISIDLLKFLLKDKMSSEICRKALFQAYKYMLIMESGRNRKDEENGIFRGVRIFPVVKDLIRFKFWRETEYSKYMQGSVEFYFDRIRKLDVNVIYSGEKTFLDRGGELAILQEVLSFCLENNMNEQYLQITGDCLADFFYIRTKKTEIVDQINAERCAIARKAKNHVQVMETYGMYMRWAVKWNRKDKALEALKAAENYKKEHPDIELYRCNRFLNGKAVVLFKVKRNMKESKRIWQEMLEKCQLTDREQSWCMRWSLKCDFALKSKPLDEIIEIAQDGFRDVERKGFYRAAVDYLLYIAKCYFLLYLQDPLDKGYVDQMERELKKAKDLLDKHSFLDNQYKAEYLYFYCCVLMIRGEEIQETLQQASKMAFDVNETHKYRTLKRILAELEKAKENGDFQYKNGDFYDKIVCFC